MFCYHCGCQLSDHDFCTACGVDVSLYKKIMHVSNMYYNEGLEKASVRDLSGAINSLRQSLKFNKNNIEARNLLGLVYFEMGEVVPALSEWVISKNLRPEKNIADDYIDMVQSNGSRLESINSTIKKYNQAYTYCTQNSKDLAVIQLKKVLSMNPRFLRAHQLLALLYIDSEQWDRAKRELVKCMDIDCNNTLTLRYLKVVDAVLEGDEATKTIPRRKKDEAVRYQSDNEIIIQPLNVKEPVRSGASTLLNIGIGLVVGLAAMSFLVVPAAQSKEQNKAKVEIAKISNQIDVKNSQIAELETKLEDLEETNSNLQQEIQGYIGADGTLQNIDSLFTAAVAYLQTQDLEQTAANLESIAANVQIEETSQAFQDLYGALRAAIGPELAAGCYDAGRTAYNSNNFQEAIVQLEKAVYYDTENVEYLYSLGNAYRQNGDTDKAIAAYDRLIELFPDSNRVNRAQQYKEELAGEN